MTHVILKIALKPKLVTSGSISMRLAMSMKLHREMDTGIPIVIVAPNV
jgi:hypothetical protein